MRAVSIADYRDMARRRLPRFLFDYIDGGSYSETTLRRNVTDLETVELRQRVMRNVSSLDLSIDLFGYRFALPVGLGPIGLAGINTRRGECQAVRAAEAADIPFCLSTLSACPIDEVAGAARRPFWFQLYMLRDRVFVADLMDKAAAAGCSALVFTVDLPVPGTRYRDYRSGLSGSPGWKGAVRRYSQALSRPRWAWDVGVLGRPLTLGNVTSALNGKSGLEDLMGWVGGEFDASVTWRDLDFIRDRWKGPLIIKGILDPEDAIAAADIGADGLVVSNHGGRQLDGVSSTARALPAIADAVGDRLTVLADGGVRSGLDVARLLALGAKSVLLGRAWVYALSAGGQTAVRHMLTLIEAELRAAMALSGASTISDLASSISTDMSSGCTAKSGEALGIPINPLAPV